jgi:hypothetical protein
MARKIAATKTAELIGAPPRNGGWDPRNAGAGGRDAGEQAKSFSAWSNAPHLALKARDSARSHPSPCDARGA